MRSCAGWSLAGGCWRRWGRVNLVIGSVPGKQKRAHGDENDKRL